MRISVMLLCLSLPVFVGVGSAQTANPNSTPVYPPQGGSPTALDHISSDLSRLTKSVETLNRNWKKFFDTFSTNQSALLLDERQRKLVFAFEILNRMETSMVNMQKLRLELAERQSSCRQRLAIVTDNLRPESIDRSTAWRGTTDAEGVRDIRRQALIKEQRELNVLLAQITRDLDQTNEEIRKIELQIASIRARVYGETERELADL